MEKRELATLVEMKSSGRFALNNGDTGQLSDKFMQAVIFATGRGWCFSDQQHKMCFRAPYDSGKALFFDSVAARFLGALGHIERCSVPDCEICLGDWEELDDDDRDALLEWFNVANPDHEERAQLAHLQKTGRFTHFECGNCRTHVLAAHPDCIAKAGPFSCVKQMEYFGELCATCAAQYFKLKEFAGE